MKDEVPYSEILKKAENGEFHEWNFQPLDFQENGYEDVIDEIKKYTAVDYLHLKELKEKAEKDGDKQAAQEYADKMEEMVQAVMKIYRTKNIFPIQYFSEFGILDEIAKCIAYKAEFDGNTVSCVTGDTEFFNGKKWKRIDEYTEGDKVLQYNPDGTATLVDPLRYIHYQSNDPFYSQGVYCLPITTNHNIPVRSEDGKIALTPLSSVFSLYNYIRTITIPASAEYDNHTGNISNQALLDTYAAVVWQDKKHMTVYNTIDEEENIILSDECYNLSLRNRRMLLSLFGLSEYVIDDLLEETFDNGRVWTNGNNLSKSLFSIISGLVSLSYKDVTLIKYEHISSAYLSKDNFMMTNKGEWDKLEGVKDKYCFSVPSHMLVLRYKGRIHITGNCGAGIGTSLCNYLFPNLYDTPSAHDLDKENARSLFEKFHNDKYLRRAIEFCFGYKNGCPVPTSVTGGLRLVGSAPTNFRPMNAKAVYERFCPKGGVIYDYCCVSGDTEYFNGYEWKPISEYVYGDKVLQYNEDGTAELVLPLEYISYASNDPFYEYQSTGHLRTCQTGNHDVVYKTTGGDVCKIKQERILKGFVGLIPITVKYKGKDITPSEEKISFVATALKGEDWRNSLDCFDWSVNSKMRLLNKLFPYEDTLELHEEKAVSIISDLIRMSGHVSSVVEADGYWKLTWRTKGSTRDEWFASYDCIRGEFREVKESYKYCFVVPSHMLVLKRKGEIYVTGNCGFGGRLLGALSSKNNYRYVGTDPCTETMYHLHQLGQYIEQVTGREDSYELHCCGSEEFKGPKNSIDFAFSSPPYFNLEVYSDEPTQCFNKFPELEGWLEGFVRPTIQNIKHMLKPGKLYAVNIADFKVGSGKEVAYVDEWIRISTEEGMPLFDTVYLGVTARAGSAEQAAGELKKENILIFKKPLW
jgi:hypothetical protein